MSDLYNALNISTHGMKAQSARIKVISENVANADTAGLKPGDDPYTRKTITFKNELDRQTKSDLVSVDKISQDKKAPFIEKYMPDHPGADASGMVKMPNINTLVELMDMKEAQRTYEANLGMVEQSKNMVNQTIDLMRR
jgi:flagellar basal-body rod protein FlgC